MDFGDATFTSFEGSTEWLDFFERFPQVNPLTKEKDWYLGKIHSHHSMEAYHSGTDTQDLYENAPKLPFFLSVVVNYKCLPFAEIAVEAEGEQKEVKRMKWNLKNWTKVGSSTINKAVTKVPTTYVIPCDTVYEEEAWFIDRLVALANKPKPVTTVMHSTNSYGMGFQQNQHYQNQRNSKNQSWQKDEEFWDNYQNGKGNRSPSALNTKAKAKLMAAISELITLDTHSKSVPAHALRDCGAAIPMAKRTEYKNAFKHYFMQYWFINTFGETTVTKTEALDGIQEFINYHRELWIHTPLTEAINELKKDISLLQPLQRPALV